MKTKLTYCIKITLNTCILIVFSSFFYTLQAQQSKLEKQAKKYMAEASAYIERDNFADAEASLRKAMSISPENKKAAYNFGNLYITNKKNRTAFQRLVEAVSENEDKDIKHKSYHNKGNIFMSEERYAEAVEAYKNALRNNPNDDETRYNLALAKKKMEDEGGDGGDDDDQDKQDEQEQENEDEGEGENEDDSKGQDEESDEKDDQQGEDKDEQNQGDGENDPDDGENEEQEDEQPSEGKSPDDEKEGEQQQPPPEQVQGKLSPEQLQNLLEAIENQEKEIQDKLNEKEQKGQKVKTEKDW